MFLLFFLLGIEFKAPVLAVVLLLSYILEFPVIIFFKRFASLYAHSSMHTGAHGAQKRSTDALELQC